MRISLCAPPFCFLHDQVRHEHTPPPSPDSPANPPRKRSAWREDGWNSRNPEQVSLAYTEDTVWRNRAEFVHGRGQVVEFLTRKWRKELDYRLIKELWAHDGSRIAVRYAYEWHDDSGNWFRSYGN